MPIAKLPNVRLHYRVDGDDGAATHTERCQRNRRVGDLQVAHLGEHRQRLPALLDRPLVVAELGVQPAHAVQGDRLPGPVAGLPMDLVGPGGVGQRGPIAALHLEQAGQIGSRRYGPQSR